MVPMNQNDMNKIHLKDELENYGKQGVRLLMEGAEIQVEDSFVELLLREGECTYMRNYIFQDGRVIGIEFDKVYL